MQTLGPLREAAYRLIGTATCLIEEADGFFHCALEARAGVKDNPAELRARFCDLVTDENLRAKVASETEGVRNVILALAFGALAEKQLD